MTELRPSDGAEPSALGTGLVPTPAAPVDQAGTNRAAAFAAGPSRMPRKVIAITLTCLALIGLAGVVLDHFFPGPVGSSTTTTLAGSYPPPFQTTPLAAREVSGPAAGPQLPASVSALMDQQPLGSTRAPGFSLVDQHGRLISLSSFRGKVVVLSFFDAACDDICPVLETELRRAYLDLGTDASRVALVTVNTDPLALTAASARPAETAAGISSLSAWYFLTGSVPQLNPVWSSYGISIDVQRHTGAVSHNDFLFFIDASGRLRSRATPFADESGSGQFSLSPVTETAWAAGIARQVRSLLGGRA